jgi:surface protein
MSTMDAASRLNISNWDVGAVTNMDNTFGGDCPLNYPARWCQSDYNGIIQKQYAPYWLYGWVLYR